MTETTIKRLSLSGSASSDWLVGLARGRVMKLLENLSRGRLTIEDSDGIHVFGESELDATPCAHIKVEEHAFYRDVMQGGSIGAAEGYIRGSWSTPDLLQVTRVMSANMDVLEGVDDSQSLIQRLAMRVFHAMNRNSEARSRKNISAHYDLGNDFFQLFLDNTMMYSAAIFPSAEATLEQASVNKLETICQKLELDENDHLLEIGTGWGGMAIHAAKHYGCRVTTTTISKEQYEFARDWVAREKLQDRVEVLLQDYRQLSGTYDKLVSIEMIEAVGAQYYAEYFATCSRLLRDDGLMMIQAILMPDQRYEKALHSVDFIQRYIFPGGSLPSQGAINHHVGSQTDMQILDVNDITADYALTLGEWRHRCQENRDAMSEQGFDSAFQRLWHFYLCYCEGGFRERVIATAQMLMAKPGYRSPLLEAS